MAWLAAALGWLIAGCFASALLAGYIIGGLFVLHGSYRALLSARDCLLRAWLSRHDGPWVRAVRSVIDDVVTHPSSTLDGGVRTAPVPQRLPVKIMPHLLIGDRLCASELDRLRAHRVTHVLNVAGDAGAPDDAVKRSYGEAGIVYECLEADDEEGFPLIERHQVHASSFIRGCLRAGGTCLIHCVAGINRSGALAAAGARPTPYPATRKMHQGHSRWRVMC